MTPWFILPIILSALVSIYGETAHRRRVVFIFKPLTTILVIALAASLPAAEAAYRNAILIGLGFSLAGDIFLMLPDRFLPGLVAFLLAHLAYLWAFTRHVPFAAAILPFVVVALVSAAVLAILWAGVARRMRLPVVAYVVAIGAMTAQAITQGMLLAVPAAWASGIGAALFFLSDATLAFNRFRRSFRGARAIILSTYWAAQTLIALSVTITTN